MPSGPWRYRQKRSAPAARYLSRSRPGWESGRRGVAARCPPATMRLLRPRFWSPGCCGRRHIVRRRRMQSAPGRQSRLDFAHTFLLNQKSQKRVASVFLNARHFRVVSISSIVSTAAVTCCTASQITGENVLDVELLAFGFVVADVQQLQKSRGIEIECAWRESGWLRAWNEARHLPGPSAHAGTGSQMPRTEPSSKFPELAVVSAVCSRRCRSRMIFSRSSYSSWARCMLHWDMQAGQNGHHQRARGDDAACRASSMENTSVGMFQFFPGHHQRRRIFLADATIPLPGRWRKVWKTRSPAECKAGSGWRSRPEVSGRGRTVEDHALEILPRRLLHPADEFVELFFCDHCLPPASCPAIRTRHSYSAKPRLQTPRARCLRDSRQDAGATQIQLPSCRWRRRRPNCRRQNRRTPATATKSATAAIASAVSPPPPPP